MPYLPPRSPLPSRPVVDRLLPPAIYVELDDPARVSRAEQAWLGELRRRAARDTAAYRRLLRNRDMFPVFFRRDTIGLGEWVAATDADTSAFVRAYVALGRGDSAQARAIVASGSPEAGPQGTYLWADLRARLGDLRGAVQTFAALDSVNLGEIWWGGVPLVRSYAERGALYQELDERDRAIEMYEKFIAAWEQGDEEPQKMVARARQALAALRGETAPPVRR